MQRGYVPKRLFAFVTGTAFGTATLPAAVADLVDPSVRAEALPLWREFRACYPNEAAAIQAAQRNPAVIQPFQNTAGNIEGSWRVLSSMKGFTDAEALQLITRNPGILGNRPGDLIRTSELEIKGSVSLVEAVDSIPAEIRAVIPPVTAVSIVSLIVKRLYECQGQCG